MEKIFFTILGPVKTRGDCESDVGDTEFHTFRGRGRCFSHGTREFIFTALVQLVPYVFSTFLLGGVG